MNIFKNCFLILMVSSSLLLSGCEMISAQEYNKAENFSADIGVTGSESAVEEETAISDTTNKTVGIVEEYPDFDEINKITIGNETVSLPFKAEDLGDEFYVDNYIDEKGTIYKKDYCLYYNQIPISFVNIDNNNYITHIDFAFLENEIETPIYWSIYLFDNDSENNDVLNHLGNPTNCFISDNNSSEMYTYIYDSGVFSIYFRNGKLDRILLEI